MTGFEDIVYENRNKDYGSYILRQKYHTYRVVGFLLSLACTIIPLLLTLLYFYFDTYSSDNFSKLNKEDIIQMTNITELYLPPPPQATPAPVHLFDTPIVIDSTLEKKPEPEKTKEDKQSAKADSAVTKTTADSAVKTDSTATPSDTIVYVGGNVKLPEFVGGDIAFEKFLRKNFNFSVKKSKRMEEVIVKFIVSKTGEVKELSVVKGVEPMLDSEVLRVMAMCPPLVPARHEGRPASVWCFYRIHL